MLNDMFLLKLQCSILKLFGGLLLINLLLFYPLTLFASELSKYEVLKKAGELMIEYHPGMNSGISSLIEAEALLTKALKIFQDDLDIIRQRITIRILLRHYEDALMDIESLESPNVAQPWQKANNLKCMLLERLDKPENVYLSCYIESIKALEIMQNNFPLRSHITFEIAFSSILAEDLATTEWALDKLKNDPNVSQEIFDVYQGTIDAVRTKKGRKEVIYNVLP